MNIVYHNIIPSGSFSKMPVEEFGPRSICVKREADDSFSLCHWDDPNMYGIVVGVKKPEGMGDRAFILKAQQYESINPEEWPIERYFIATVHVIVRAETDSEACDVFSATLTDNDGVLDWSYEFDVITGKYRRPTEVDAGEFTDYDVWPFYSRGIGDGPDQLGGGTK